MYMTLKEAHEKAVTKDRRLRIDGIIAGAWYEDRILDFVAEHGDKPVKLTISTAQYIAVTMQEA